VEILFRQAPSSALVKILKSRLADVITIANDCTANLREFLPYIGLRVEILKSQLADVLLIANN